MISGLGNEKNNPEELFEYLSQRGIGKYRLSTSGLDRLIDKWSIADIIDFCTDVSNKLPGPLRSAVSPFQFIASSTLGGGRHPCIAAECRIRNIFELCQFSALYSENTLIPDPFEDLIYRSRGDLESYQREVSLAIEILYLLRPLIERGIVQFARSSFSFCTDCYDKIIKEFESSYKEKSVFMKEYLRDRYYSETSVYVGAGKTSDYLEIRGPEELIEHGARYLHFLKTPDYVKDLISDKPKKVDNLIINKETGNIDYIIQNIMDDFFRHNYYSNIYGFNYLSKREVDFSLIRKLNENFDSEFSYDFSDILSHEVPIIPNADISSLVKLRLNEAEAFSVYRNSLAETMDLSRTLSMEELRQAFDDIVRPEIDKIDHSVKNSKKILKNKIGKDIVFAAGFVGLGTFGGILPANIGAIVAALGGFHYTSDLLGNIKDLFSEPSVARDSKFYFYWKAREVARASR